MPPRQPLKAPAAARTKRASRRTAPAMAASALAEVAATLRPSQPEGSRRSSNLSPYPDLHMAIHMLEVSLKSAKAEKQQLLAKWVQTLGKIQTEMQALHKLEVLKNRLNPDTK